MSPLAVARMLYSYKPSLTAAELEAGSAALHRHANRAALLADWDAVNGVNAFSAYLRATMLQR